FPFYIFGVWYFFGRLRRLTRERSQALAEVQGFLHERIQGINVIKSFAVEKNEEGRFNVRNSNFLDKATNHAKWTARSFSVVNTITDIGPMLVVGYGAYQVIHGNLTVGTLAAFIAYLDRLYGPLRRLVSSSTTLTQSIASMDRVFQLYDVKYDVQDRKDAKKLGHTNANIEVIHVGLDYNGEDKSVLNDLDYDVGSVQHVAFGDMRGGGNSSLVTLVPRFYDVTEGWVKLDGEDIRNYTIESLRNNIGLVMQDNILFSDSIMENIMFDIMVASAIEVVDASILVK